MSIGAPLELWVLALTIVLLTLLWGQVLIMHYRGSFYRLLMWEPVVLIPIIVVAGLVALVLRGIALDVFAVLLSLAFLAGLTGTMLHVRGVLRRVGGWNLDNIMVGPPILFPLCLSFISLAGIVASVSWRY